MRYDQADGIRKYNGAIFNFDFDQRLYAFRTRLQALVPERALSRDRAPRNFQWKIYGTCSAGLVSGDHGGTFGIADLPPPPLLPFSAFSPKRSAPERTIDESSQRLLYGMTSEGGSNRGE